MFGALVLGLGVGLLGGYFAGGSGDAKATAAKDGAAAVAATGAAPGAAANAKNPNARPTPPPGKPVYIALEKYSPRLGPEHAKVTILEYSDYQ